MRQKELEKWLKIVIIAVALCGLVVCAVAIPWIGHVLIASDPQLSDMYIPWLVLFIISAIPCYVISHKSDKRLAFLPVMAIVLIPRAFAHLAA